MDYEIKDFYNIIIEVCDLGSFVFLGYISFLVIVSDVDDNVFVFYEDKYIVSLLENVIVGMFVV